METACFLAEQFLPEVTEPLSAQVGSVVDTKQLFDCIENLGEALGLESVARSTVVSYAPGA
jgi:hypothetical protein